MREILRESNLDLLREVDRLRSLLHNVRVPIELSGYYEWIVNSCDSLCGKIIQHLYYLDLDRVDILDDILSKTQETTREFQLYNQRLMTSIFRFQASDQLCLKILRWLHINHSQTKNIPLGLSDGEFGSWPVRQFPTIYFMPSSAQHGLLYLPLFFHEFGHLIYTCHKEEFEGLISDLQERIASLLEPVSQHDDLYAQTEAETRNAIIETWYEWTQELLCDAIGVEIGGPSFLWAFSMYLRMRGRGEFHLPPERLAHRQHPITWLRIRLLADRAQQRGCAAGANALRTVWDTIAAMMGVTEDYYGFYVDEFLPSIRNTIDSMLIKASPYHFTESDVSDSDWIPGRSSPVHLLNRAWSIFLSDPGHYRNWEEKAISSLLANL